MTEYRWRRSNAPLASSRTDDIFFVDARLGWAVGGNAEVADPQREDCRPIVGYVSMENFTDAAILKTADGGRTWERKPVNDPQDNANLEGIGLFDAELGWTGGWGDESFQSGFTSETSPSSSTGSGSCASRRSSATRPATPSTSTRPSRSSPRAGPS